MRPYTKKIQEIISRQITDDNDVKGGLVYAMLAERDRLFLVFDDGRWACYRRYAYSEGGGGIELMEDTPEVYELKEACLVHSRDYEEYQTFIKKLLLEEERGQELATLKRLQAKYGHQGAKPEDNEGGSVI